MDNSWKSQTLLDNREVFRIMRGEGIWEEGIHSINYPQKIQIIS